MSDSKPDNKSLFPIEIKVVKILEKGVCSYGHKTGDVFVVEANEQPFGLCAWAFNSIFPFLTVLRFGGDFPWEEEAGKAVACCPDPHNPVVFELRRL